MYHLQIYLKLDYHFQFRENIPKKKETQAAVAARQIEVR